MTETKDLLHKAGTFYNTNPMFVASALTSNPHIQVSLVDNHPTIENYFIYYLSPEREAHDLFVQFQAGELKVDARKLQYKLSEVRQLRPTINPLKYRCKICGTRSNFNYQDMCEKCSREISFDKYGDRIMNGGGVTREKIDF